MKIFLEGNVLVINFLEYLGVGKEKTKNHQVSLVTTLDLLCPGEKSLYCKKKKKERKNYEFVS